MPYRSAPAPHVRLPRGGRRGRAAQQRGTTGSGASGSPCAGPAEGQIAPDRWEDTIGCALLEVRMAMRKKEDGYWALWAAYQHYGDPGFRITDL